MFFCCLFLKLTVACTWANNAVRSQERDSQSRFLQIRQLWEVGEKGNSTSLQTQDCKSRIWVLYFCFSVIQPIDFFWLFLFVFQDFLKTSRSLSIFLKSKIVTNGRKSTAFLNLQFCVSGLGLPYLFKAENVADHISAK